MYFRLNNLKARLNLKGFYRLHRKASFLWLPTHISKLPLFPSLTKKIILNSIIANLYGQSWLFTCGSIIPPHSHIVHLIKNVSGVS